ncbi:VOC family protein [Sphingomicrobium lutaoense]|uniref:Putative 3-demethylubiquinone-9 3-methyltransferase (Glyoxalase superfamily) n=1 Tax=Sphingomicrobium lutaoense TaxID=515949 RepID=A0A839Z437_9SPHN|nr:VOC family protein [Sphingomicrobium lutaoense]MBB3764593.1 putative 3-demethylubiquinone-9 3-methyltransferase (glyoxalase superfamily) [Sphingomicrobium lutaoense]
MSSALRPCLWYDGDAEEAARLYAGAIPGSRLLSLNRAPHDWPAGTKGDVITVDMEVAGQRVMLLNGGDAFRPSPATSLMIVTGDQEETDRCWDALLADGGSAMACGWCVDRFGHAWQVTPRRLLDLLADEKQAANAFAAMNEMVKIDIAALDRACAP